MLLTAKVILLTFSLLTLSQPLIDDKSTKTKLPLGVILDSQGKPISIPSNVSSALELESANLKSIEQPKKVKTKKKKKKSTRKNLANNN